MTARTSPHPTSRLVRIVAAAALTLGVLGGPSGSASAGGWAVATLDATPVAEPGASTEVSFSILQHGVRPVDIESGVGIDIVQDDGTTAFFPAAGDGVLGHYVATVTFPDTAGTYRWSVRMGTFGPYDLGPLDVREPASGGSAWPTARWLALGATMALAGVAIVDLAVARRRRLALG